jgi:hypothetical protein
MILLRVCNLVHFLSTSRTIDIYDFIEFLAHFRVTTVQKFGHPLALQYLSFTNVEPDPFATNATIHSQITTVSDFFHVRVALRTFHNGATLVVCSCMVDSRGSKFLMA